MKAFSVLFALGALALSMAQDKPQVPLITVTGNGQVMADPDEATVRLGVTKQAATAADAQNQANQVMQGLLSRIEGLGIQERDIRTTRLMVNPVYSQTGTVPTIVGYRASSLISVRLTDFVLVGKVIDASIAVGGNTLEGVSFGLRNDLPSRLEALQEAAVEAKAKAEALAEALGVKLGALYEVVEGGASWSPMPGMEMARGAVAGTPTPVEPGQITVTASVTVKYVILSG